MSAPSAVAVTAVLDEEPVLDGPTLERWQATVEAVNAQKRMLGAFLQESRFLGVTARALVLAADDLHRSVVDERDNRGLVEAHAAEIFRRPLVLQCVPVGPEDRPRAPATDDFRPLVERARQWFDGDPVTGPARATRRSDA